MSQNPYDDIPIDILFDVFLTPIPGTVEKTYFMSKGNIMVPEGSEVEICNDGHYSFIYKDMWFGYYPAECFDSQTFINK